MNSFELEINNLKKCYYLHDYLPKSKFSQDENSKLILDFKDNGSSVSNWCNEASNACREAFSNTYIDIIVRVLGHDELKADFKNLPLDELGKSIGKAINARYYPQILQKTDTNRSLKFLSRENRENELQNKYIFRAADNKGDISILIIDDITTTGSTISEVCRAIREKLPSASIYFFALGKTKTKQKIILENEIPKDDLEYLKKVFSNPENEKTFNKKVKKSTVLSKESVYSKYLSGTLPEKVKKAYSPWTEDEDQKLTSLFIQGKSTKDISSIMKRTTGAINARINKLELRDT